MANTHVLSIAGVPLLSISDKKEATDKLAELVEGGTEAKLVTVPHQGLTRDKKATDKTESTDADKTAKGKK